jgi:hypothetical protein
MTPSPERLAGVLLCRWCSKGWHMTWVAAARCAYRATR